MPARIKSTQLCNGLRVHYRMGTEVEMLERELFEDNAYFSEGIAVHDGAIVFDVGANAGMFVLLLATLIKDATVFSFEPIPDTFELLALNAKEAKGFDVRLLNCGLSNQSRTVEFTHYPRHSVMSSMYPSDTTTEFRDDSRRNIRQIMRRRGGFYRFIADYSPPGLMTVVTEVVRRHYQKGTKVRCQVRTLSEIIDECSPPHIDLLKIDAEKSEFDILEGLRDEHWPLVRQVIVEVHDGPASVDRALAVLRERQFEAWTTPPAIPGSLLAHVYARRR